MIIESAGFATKASTLLQSLCAHLRADAFTDKKFMVQSNSFQEFLEAWDATAHNFLQFCEHELNLICW